MICVYEKSMAAINFTSGFAFPFNAGKDFDSNIPQVHYQECLDQGRIYINIDALLSRERNTAVGEVVFAYHAKSGYVVYFPEFNAYFRTPEEDFSALHSSQILDEDAPEIKEHNRYFSDVFAQHPFGNNLQLIYGRKFSFQFLRNRTFNYLGGKLRQEPSLLEQLLDQTGGEKCPMKQPYWTEADKDQFLERLRSTFR
jgi:hypothetical protein